MKILGVFLITVFLASCGGGTWWGSKATGSLSVNKSDKSDGFSLQIISKNSNSLKDVKLTRRKNLTSLIKIDNS